MSAFDACYRPRETHREECWKKSGWIGGKTGRRREGREIYVRLYFAWDWKSDLKSVFFFKFRFFLFLCARARKFVSLLSVFSATARFHGETFITRLSIDAFKHEGAT